MKDCELTEARLVERFEGTLAPDEGEALARHLEDCADCRTLAGDYEAILETYRGLSAEDVSAGVAADVLAAARAAPAGRPGSRRGVPRWVRVVLVAAAAALLAVLAPWGTAPGERPDVAEGRRLLEAGRLEPALAWYEQARPRLAGTPDEPVVLHRIGELRLRLGDPEAALRPLTLLDERYPAYGGRAEALRLEAEALLALGRGGDAARTYRRLGGEFPELLGEAQALAEAAEKRDELDLQALEGLGYIGD